MSARYLAAIKRAKANSDLTKVVIRLSARYNQDVGEIKTVEETYDERIRDLENKIAVENRRVLAHTGLDSYGDVINRIVRLQVDLRTLREMRQATADEREMEHLEFLEEKDKDYFDTMQAVLSMTQLPRSSQTRDGAYNLEADVAPGSAYDGQDGTSQAKSRHQSPAVCIDEQAADGPGSPTASVTLRPTSPLRHVPDIQPSTARAGKRPAGTGHGKSRPRPATGPPSNEDGSARMTKRQRVVSPDESDDESEAEPPVRGAAPPPPDHRASQQHGDTPRRQSSPAQYVNAAQGTGIAPSLLDNETPRQLTSPPRRSKPTTTFNEVFCGGKAAWRHPIVRHSNTGKFYIFKCDTHGVHFKAPDFGGAKRHLRSPLHGYETPEPSHDIVIELMGIEVVDCTDELMKQNNDLLDKDINEGRYTVLNKSLMTSDQIREAEEAAANRKLALQDRIPVAAPSSARDTSPAPTRGTSQETGSDILGVVDTKAGDPYFAYDTTREAWFVALALPRGAAFDDKTLEQLRLPKLLLHSRGLMEDPPACYTFSKFSRKRTLHGWADGFKRHGERVRDRKFPVLFFDKTDFINKGTVAWVLAKDLRVFKPSAVVASKVPQLRCVGTYFRDVGRWDIIEVMEAEGWRCPRWEEESTPGETDGSEVEAEEGWEEGLPAGEEHAGGRDGKGPVVIQVDSDGYLSDYDFGPPKEDVPGGNRASETGKAREREPRRNPEPMDDVNEWRRNHGEVQGQDDVDGVDARTGHQPDITVERPQSLGQVETLRQGRKEAQPTIPLPSATTFHLQRETVYARPASFASQINRDAQPPPPEQHGSTHHAPVPRPTDGPEGNEQLHRDQVHSDISAPPHPRAVPSTGRSPSVEPLPQDILDIIEAAARGPTPDGRIYMPPANHVFSGQASALASRTPSQALLNMASKATKQPPQPAASQPPDPQSRPAPRYE